MIPLALKAWSIAKALPWRYIIAALAVLALVLGAYHWAYDRGRSSRDVEVANLTNRATAAESSVKTLRASIADQNKAIDTLKTTADRKQAAGAAALAAVNAENRRQASTMAALRKSAAHVYAAGAPCTISDALTGTDGL